MTEVHDRSSLQKNVKGSLSDGRKMIPDENMDGYKGTESIRNGVWINIKKVFFLFFKIFSKGN